MEEKLEEVKSFIGLGSNIGLLAEWLVNKKDMNHKKIQILCYYAKVWGLIALDTDIIPNIEFEAWVHGPVNVEIYQRCKKFGWRDIKVAYDIKEKSINEINSLFSDEQKEILEFGWNSYGEFTADELEAFVHNELPWIEARKDTPPYKNSENIINKETIKRFYTQKFSKYLS